ncbi:hypothetical protein ABW21_db0207101 [Orbilia brochopaga]|nr:hypothetical protein ABW21_db0207101 [Drechslerella brochopaga]
MRCDGPEQGCDDRLQQTTVRSATYLSTDDSDSDGVDVDIDSKPEGASAVQTRGDRSRSGDETVLHVPLPSVASLLRSSFLPAASSQRYQLATTATESNCRRRQERNSTGSGCHRKA